MRTKRDNVLQLAADAAISARDLAHLFDTSRRASQFLYKLHAARLIERVGGDGTKEAPFRYRISAAGRALLDAPPPFDATGLDWLVRSAA